MGSRVAFAVVVLSLAAAGIAIAAKGGGSSDVILCAKKSNGALSLASKGKCGKGSRKLIIAKQGPRGDAGPAGAQGAPGTTASIQPEPVRQVGEAVIGGCAANPGTFCGAVAPEARWISAGPPYAPVGYWKDAAGEVHLQGTIDGGGGGGALLESFFYLPPGYRPSGERHFMLVNCSGGEPFPVEIVPSGLVQMRAFEANTCPSFDGVSFRP